MKLRVVPVEPDEQLIREVLVHLDDLDLDAVERCQIPDSAFLQVDRVEPPILVSALVLHVEEMTAVVGPEEGPDAPVPVIGDDLGFVDAVERGDPHVEHILARRDPRQPLAVRGDARADPLRVAEQDLAGNEGDAGHNDQATALRAAAGLRGYDAHRKLRHQEAALAVSAYILIQTEVGKAAQVAAEVSQIDGVVSAEDVTGPYDVIVRSEANSVDDLGKMVVSRVQLIDGITRTLTCPVVNLG